MPYQEPLLKIPKYHLNAWYMNFGEMHSFDSFAQNSVEIVHVQKIPTLGNELKLGYFKW